MITNKRRRLATIAVGGLGLALVAASCGAPENNASDKLSDDELDCANYEQFGSYKDGESVTIYSPITAAEADAFEAAWAPFQECTGLEIVYDGSNEFEAQIKVRVDGGDAPDIAFFPQPGLMQNYADKLVPASDKLAETATAGWSEDWLQYGTIDDTLYAAPLSGNLKSLVWYSPSYFKDNKYEVPETWEDMMALSEKIAEAGTKPWCAGIGSDAATGWPATDWLEDMMLRESGGDVYDQWVNHDIAFDDEAVVTALDKAGSILKNDDFVNGGHGSVKSIAQTSFEEAGLPILDGECAMHRQASFYGAQWGEDVKVGPDGDVFAFFLPGNTAEEKPLLGGGEFVAAFSDAPEVDAFRTYLASGLFANARMKTGPWASAHSEADPANASDPLMKMVVELFGDENAEFRFDASDLMPGDIGSGAFFKEMTNWINGKSSEDALGAVEKAWQDS
ncbi:ABC transporter substrate-binding protein [Stackebrandtia soli]|uniref:ABC transporter substrate-binding protein n=1 Tax=Stackebrandtia soli TaxID=1892856 RepID=UPI0039EBFC76